MNPPTADPVVRQTRLILDSYHRCLGVPLIPPADDARAAQSLFDAPFVTASTDTAEDPILNYGNRAALALWELSWEEFTCLPGRRTAEAPERAKRERFLNEVRQNGFIKNYSGVRVTRTGRRFRIHDATVWNLTEADGQFAGQAVTFDQWTWL